MAYGLIAQPALALVIGAFITAIGACDERRAGVLERHANATGDRRVRGAGDAPTGSADYVPLADRIAVFDNDGTLWWEKPMPIELGFILVRLAEMARGR